ncbi:DUF721 domain-containing protein [uncultured Enterovirga sp.]|uniref:DUF721 domain-containing protein n=1 Tax=uncultured Enterovirga sp. TaxID=2026352 RepID=UPI0035CA0CB2
MKRKGQGRSQPLADLVGPVLGPALAAQGFTGADLVASWAEIVGERMAEASRPVRVEWPRRRPGESDGAPHPATLVVRVVGAFALELQHLAPLVLERINAVYGWRCVGRLVLKQGPVGRLQPPKAEKAPLPESARIRIAEAVAGLDEAALRQAMERLGRAMATRPDEPDEADLALPRSG